MSEVLSITDLAGLTSGQVGDIRRLGAEGLFVTADVTVEREVAGTIEQTLGTFGCLDAVFNNAGFREKRTPTRRADRRHLHSRIRHECQGGFPCKHEIPALLASGGGTIVKNTSVVTLPAARFPRFAFNVC